MLVLAERHHGRKHLLDQLLASSRRRNTKNRGVGASAGVGGVGGASGASGARVHDSGGSGGPSLALGYQVLEVRDDGDEGKSLSFHDNWSLDQRPCDI